MRNNGTREAKVLGSPMLFKNPLLPSNIIWENREKQSKGFVMRHAIAVFAFFCLLLSSSVIFYSISSWEESIRDIFPPVDCDFITQVYRDKLQKFALEDFL